MDDEINPNWITDDSDESEEEEPKKLTKKSIWSIGKKHKGTKLNIIWKNDPFYMKWVIDQHWCPEFEPEFEAEIRRERCIDLNFKLLFKERRGKRLKHLLKIELGFMIWFVEFLCTEYDVILDEKDMEIYRSAISADEDKADELFERYTNKAINSMIGE